MLQHAGTYSVQYQTDNVVACCKLQLNTGRLPSAVESLGKVNGIARKLLAKNTTDCCCTSEVVLV